MPDPVSDLINTLRRGQEAVRRATVEIESERDPKYPGRTAYRFTGRSRDAVQYAIDRRIREVDECGGFANFVGPARLSDGRWAALGEVVLQPQSAA